MRGAAKIAVWVVMLFGAASVYGQSAEAFRRELSLPDSLTGSSVRVAERGSAAEVIYMHDLSGKPSSVSGYRVRIFFDNSQAARNDSAHAQERFRELFPDIPSYRAYESPSWIVTVGNCSTMEEALILQNKVKRSFQTAFIWRGEIPLEEFLKEGDNVPQEEQVPEIPEENIEI